MEKEKEGSKSKKVMVAIDETESSYRALIWVLENLKESISKSPLVIFAAQPLPNHVVSSAGIVGFAAALIKRSQDLNRKVSLGLLEKAKSICASRGVAVETFTETGDPKETIWNMVQNYKIDLLVMGDSAYGSLGRASLGSLSSYCLTNAKCHVLVVKKTE
ncbi:universal stress protein A-like protein isoform X2 [Ziziphus jujuba]|uniref:Universal stress protein A-like protein isoform X2 n=1 Tax=Ziziphus jujuba TaxID=326968 RepID=A0ABM3I2I5_ZIZJJ|nr:universal stress protein A-like protein isoform X2 [Ziziphus jujuba]